MYSYDTVPGTSYYTYLYCILSKGWNYRVPCHSYSYEYFVYVNETGLRFHGMQEKRKIHDTRPVEEYTVPIFKNLICWAVKSWLIHQYTQFYFFNLLADWIISIHKRFYIKYISQLPRGGARQVPLKSILIQISHI